MPLIHPFSTPLPLPPTPGKPRLDETPGEGPRDSQGAPLLPEPHSRAFAPARSGWAAPARLHLNLARVRTTGHGHCLPWGEAGSPLPRLFGSCHWTCGLTVPAPSAARDPRPAREERWCGPPPPQASLLRGGQAAGRPRRERAGTATGERPRPGTGGSRGRARSSPGRGRRSRGARAAPGSEDGPRAQRGPTPGAASGPPRPHVRGRGQRAPAAPRGATHPPANRWSKVLCCGMARRSAAPPAPRAAATPRAAARPARGPAHWLPAGRRRRPGGRGRRQLGGLRGEASSQSCRSRPPACGMPGSGAPGRTWGKAPSSRMFSGLNPGLAPAWVDSALLCSLFPPCRF